MRRSLTCLTVLAAGLLAASPAWAVIQRLTPLKDVLAESPLIFTAAVDTLDPDKPSVVLKVSEQLKGKTDLARLPVNLTGDSEATKGKHSELLLKRLAPELSLVVFATKQDKKYTAFAYTNGTWFQMIGEEADGAVRWSLTHGEPYFRRTFKGSTADLKQAVVDGLAGKAKPPEPDVKEKPGFGPEVAAPEKKPEEDLSRGGTRMAAPLGVIPSVAVGSAFALLAALFPAVFGGLMVVLKRWMTLLMVASLNSTLYTVYLIWGDRVQDRWWGTPLALWLVMTAITLYGILRSWRRSLAAGPDAAAPTRFEKVALAVSAVLTAVGLACYWKWPALLAPLSWKLLLVFGVGLAVGLLHLAVVLGSRRFGARPGLPTEGVVLWTMGVIAAGIALTLPRGGFSGEDTRTVVVEGGGTVATLWSHTAPGNGLIASTPLAADDRVYVATAHPGGVFGKPFGKLYCLGRDRHEVVWTFDDGGAMKQAFSSPCLADGKLYVGEGFHQDADCKLYCVDAATGQKLWDFSTGSHTESSPCVAAGKVFFGAGDDGVYCLDAATGKEVWHFQDGVHVDASPAVVEGRVYLGSGVGDAYQKLQLFCLDAATGAAVWRREADLPSWAEPTVSRGQVFFGLGNGNFLFSDATKPAGALLCVDAATGKPAWRYDVPDGVLTKPAVDFQRVAFGARDGHCYALDRSDGKLLWKHDLGSPVVASPTPAPCPCCAGTAALYVASSTGQLECLDPATGEKRWAYDIEGAPAQVLASPALADFRTAEGKRRRLYLGAGTNGGTTPVLICLEDRTGE
jgi:outer membrane protein assembly factor BamB